MSDLQVQFGAGGNINQHYLTGTNPFDLPNPAANVLAPNALSGVSFAGPFAPAGEILLTPGVGRVTASTAVDGTTSFDVLGVWNAGVKNASVTATTAEKLVLDGFVQVDVNVGANSTDGSNILINGLKRGNVITGEGHDVVTINLASNVEIWGNDVRVATNGGNDIVVIGGLNYANEAGDATYASGTGAGLKTDGLHQRTFVDLGAGNDRAIGYGSRDYFLGGAGNDRLEGGAGNDRLSGGTGRDTLRGDAGDDVVDAGLNALGGTAFTYGTFDGSFYQQLSKSANFQNNLEYAGGNEGNDVVISRGEDKVADGNDQLSGGSGTDLFYFDGLWGHDRVTDFSHKSGDKLMIASTDATGGGTLGFFRVSYTGSNADLLILTDSGNADLQEGRSILVDNFFNRVSSTVAAHYDNTTHTVAEVVALGADSIFSNDAVADAAVQAVLGNFFA